MSGYVPAGTRVTYVDVSGCLPPEDRLRSLLRLFTEGPNSSDRADQLNNLFRERCREEESLPWVSWHDWGNDLRAGTKRRRARVVTPQLVTDIDEINDDPCLLKPGFMSMFVNTKPGVYPLPIYLRGGDVIERLTAAFNAFAADLVSELKIIQPVLCAEPTLWLERHAFVVKTFAYASYVE